MILQDWISLSFTTRTGHKQSGLQLPPLLNGSTSSSERAFQQASARLKRLRQMPKDMLQISEHVMQKALFVKPEFEQRWFSSSLQGHEIYLKPDTHQAFNKLSKPSQVKEIVLSHMAFELGINHVVYGICQNVAKSKLRVFSLQPRGRFATACDWAGIYDAEMHPEFFSKYPNQYGSMLAFASFDLWARNKDRHLNNVLMVRPAVGKSAMLLGIDLDTLASDQAIGPHRGVVAVLNNRQPTPGQLAHLGAALAAIEAYPAERIHAHAQRFVAIAPPEYSPAEFAAQLIDSQKTVRECFSKLLPCASRPQVLKLKSQNAVVPA
jgi:hypothetical protein